jgi:hypothetical protein
MTYLYRHFDAEGRLLYVGISLSAVHRLAQHRASAWFASIATVTIETFPSRAGAAEAERLAIQTEGPLHNIKIERDEAAPSMSGRNRRRIIRVLMTGREKRETRRAADRAGMAAAVFARVAILEKARADEAREPWPVKSAS